MKCFFRSGLANSWSRLDRFFSGLSSPWDGFDPNNLKIVSSLGLLMFGAENKWSIIGIQKPA